MKKLILLTLLASSLLTFSQTAKQKWVNIYSRRYVNCIVADGYTIWVGTYDGGAYQTDLNGNILQEFTKDNGLPSNTINCIAIDAQGNKWFGTQDGGISKYDGTNWTTYTNSDGLVNNHVSSIAIDAQGNKWFGTSGGVSKFDDTNWTTYTTVNGLADNLVYSIAIDAQGNKWFGTENGLSKYDGTNWMTYTTANGLVNNSVYSIAIDAQGNKWFGTYKGVSKFDGTHWTTYTTSNGLVSNYVLSIAIDSQGNKWFGTGKGVSKFDDTNWTTYTTANGLADNNVNYIVIDAQGNKWFRTGGSISKFDSSNWTTYKTTVGLASNYVTSIAKDAQDNKWFGTWGGVSKYDGTNWTTYTTANGLVKNSVLSIAIDAQGNKWFGTDSGGVSKFDGTNWMTYKTTVGLASNYVTSIAIDVQGNKWFGTSGGVSKFDGTNWMTYKTNVGLAGDNVMSTAIDAQGNKWFGTNGGVSKYDGTNWTTYTKSNGLVYNYVMSIAIDAQGNKWFGTPDGVSKYDGTNWTTYTTKDGLVDNWIKSVVIDAQGNKWFGTWGGVSKYDGTNWTTYTTANGLANNEVNSITIDAQGNKWFGTEGGVSIFNENGVSFATKASIDTLSKLKGMVYYDKNKDGNITVGDFNLQKQKVLLLPDNIITQTNDAGMYSFTVDTTKTYSITVLPQTPYFAGSQALSASISPKGMKTQVPAIGLWAKDTAIYNSLLVDGGTHRCGMIDPLYYTFRNDGTNPEDVTITIAIDKNAQIVKTIPEIDSTGADGRLFWKYKSLPVSTDRQVQIQILMPTGILDTLQFSAQVLHNNSIVSTSGLNLTTKCSYDPNDKQVSPIGLNKEKLTLKNNELQYTIHFQNTGNDYAYDVKIIDSLSSQLDMSSFSVIAASHKVRSELSKNGIVTFYFDNIMLPDSSISFAASCGFVSYSIKPKTSVIENTAIQNTAHIVFDQNPAIVTNTTLNTLVSTFPFSLAGDINGNGIIDGTEIAGDVNANGKIDGKELYGDINGNNIIDIGELPNDNNGNGKIDNLEILGDAKGNIEIINTAGIVQINSGSIDIFPVPVKNTLTIRAKNECIPNFISITNSIGQVVLELKEVILQTNDIDFSNLASGIYFVQVIIDGKTYSSQIVKQ